MPYQTSFKTKHTHGRLGSKSNDRNIFAPILKLAKERIQLEQKRCDGKRNKIINHDYSQRIENLIKQSSIRSLEKSMDGLLNKIKMLFRRDKLFNDSGQSLPEEKNDNSQTVDNKYNKYYREDEEKITRKPKSGNISPQLHTNFALKKSPCSEHCNISSKEQIMRAKIKEDSPVKRVSSKNGIDDKKVKEIVEEVLETFSCQIENMCNKKIDLFLETFKHQLKMKKREKELANLSNKVKEEVIIEILKRFNNEQPTGLKVIKKKRKSKEINENQYPNCEAVHIFSTSEISQSIPERDKPATINKNVKNLSEKHQHGSRKSKRQPINSSCEMMSETKTRKRNNVKKTSKTKSGKVIGYSVTHLLRREAFVPLINEKGSHTNRSNNLLQASEDATGVHKKHKQKQERSYYKIQKHPLRSPPKSTLNLNKKINNLPPEKLKNCCELDCDVGSIATTFSRTSESSQTQSSIKSRKFSRELGRNCKRMREQPELEEMFIRSQNIQDRQKKFAPKNGKDKEATKTSSTSLQFDKKLILTDQDPIYSYCQMLASRKLDNCIRNMKPVNFTNLQAKANDGTDGSYADKISRSNKNEAKTNSTKDAPISESKLCHNKYRENQITIKPVLSQNKINSKVNKNSKFRAFLDEQNNVKASEHCQTEVFEENRKKSKIVLCDQDKICKLITAIQERLQRSEKSVKTTETSVSSAFLEKLDKSFAELYQTNDNKDLEDVLTKKIRKPGSSIVGSRIPALTGFIRQIKKQRDISVGVGTGKVFLKNESRIPQLKSAAVPPVPKTAPQLGGTIPSNIPRFNINRPSTSSKKMASENFCEKKTKFSNNLLEKFKNIPQTESLAPESHLESTAANRLITKNNYLAAEISSYEKRKQYDRERREKVIQRPNRLLKTDVGFMYIENDKRSEEIKLYNVDKTELGSISEKFGAKSSNGYEIKTALDEIEKCVNSCLNRLDSNFVTAPSMTDK